MGKLLIIDDSEADRFFIKEALENVNKSLELIELGNGKNAISTIKVQCPDATLLDIRMPGIDGFEVLKKIRKDSDLSTHPVYMLSGSKEPSDINMANSLGATGYMTKPDSMAEYNILAQRIHTDVFT